MYETKLAGNNMMYHKQSTKQKISKKPSTKYRKKYKSLSKTQKKRFAKEALRKKKRKKRNRRWNNLLKLLNSLVETPDYFVSLSYPKHYTKDEILCRIRVDINNFASRFRYQYENGWGIYSIEYKHGAKIHLHIIGKLRNGHRSSRIKRQRFKIQVFKWWARFIESDDIQRSNVKFINTKRKGEIYKGYLRKFEKNFYFKVLSEMVEGKLTFTHGMINRENIKFAPQKIFHIPDSDFEKYIRPFLIEDSDKIGGLRNHFHKRNIELKEFGFHILTRRKAIEKILRKYRVGV